MGIVKLSVNRKLFIKSASFIAVLIIAFCAVFYLPFNKIVNRPGSDDAAAAVENAVPAKNGDDTYGLTLSEYLAASGARRADISEGVSNIIKRARQMYEVTWTPKLDIIGFPGTGAETVFIEGIEYKGVPYGQPVHDGRYIGFGASIDEFVYAAADISSKMYTGIGKNMWEYSQGKGDIKYSPYYSSDCSAFISYVWGLSEHYTTAMIADNTLRRSEKGYDDALFQYVGSSVSDLRTGYALNKGSLHIILVYDVLYNKDGDMIQVTTLEETSPIMRLRVWGEGGNAGSLDDLQKKIDSAPYDIIKYKYMDSVIFEESKAVPLNTEVYINRISEPVSLYETDGSISGSAYMRDSGSLLEGWTYHQAGVTDVEYSIGGEEWVKADIEHCGELTRFSADLPKLAADPYKVYVRASYNGGMYDVAEIEIESISHDLSHLTYFENIGESAAQFVASDAIYTGEIELVKGKDSSVLFTGWSVSSGGIKGYEYKIDNGIWVGIEADFRYDVYSANTEYAETCRLYNSFTGGADFSAFYREADDGENTHTLSLRAVTGEGDTFDMAYMHVKIIEKTGLFADTPHSRAVLIILILIILALLTAAAMLLIRMIKIRKFTRTGL